MKRGLGVLMCAAVLVLGFGVMAQAEEIGEATKLFKYVVGVEKSAAALEEPVKGIMVTPEWHSEYSFLAGKASLDAAGRTVLENVIMYETNIQTEFTLRKSFGFVKDSYGNIEVDVGAILIKKVVLDPRFWKIAIERRAAKFSVSDHMQSIIVEHTRHQQTRVGAVSGGWSSSSPVSK